MEEELNQVSRQEFILLEPMFQPKHLERGSFDKGFYFQIPMDLFNNRYKGNYSTFKLAPLTRDGGAKLIHDKDLRGLIYNSTRYELNNQWNGFLN